jgi:hypothetical protein
MAAGLPGCHPSSDQAEAMLGASESSSLHAYIVLSLLIGARTEELRAVLWSDVDLVGKPDAAPPIPPSIAVWRSVRAGGDTKTKKSRQTLAMPQRCVDALSDHWKRCAYGRNPVHENSLVFVSRAGTALDAHNVRREFRTVAGRAGLIPHEWTESYGTASCRCSRMMECRSSTSHAWSATRTPS